MCTQVLLSADCFRRFWVPVSVQLPSSTSLFATHEKHCTAASCPPGRLCFGLDAGFSFTHAVPIFSNVVLDSGVRRQNLGGKVLTNYLKELVSYRQDAPGLTPHCLTDCSV